MIARQIETKSPLNAAIRVRGADPYGTDQEDCGGYFFSTVSRSKPYRIATGRIVAFCNHRELGDTERWQWM
jgi:hypothetical protein